MKQILVPTDMSAPADHAALAAVRLATLTGAEVHFFHAADVPDGFSEARFTSAAKARSSPKAQEDLYPEARARVGQARQALEELTRMAARRKVKATSSLGFNAAWREVARLASLRKADVVIMGTTGSGGAREVLIGSNTQRVLRLADRPVLTLRNELPGKVAEAVLLADIERRDFARQTDRILALLGPLKTRVHLLHVNTPERFMDTDTALDGLSRIAKALPVPCTTHVHDHFTVAEGAIAFAERHGMDLIAVLTHGRKGIRGLLNASVAETLVHHSQLPVLTDHPH